MSVPKNIFAYTAPGAIYPEFVSVNDIDGQIEITVRSPGQHGGYCEWMPFQKGQAAKTEQIAGALGRALDR